VTDRPLRPATDHRLGEPLPHQLTNRAQAPLEAPELYPLIFPYQQDHAVLAIVSNGYPPLRGRLPTCYSPVRHFPVKLHTEALCSTFTFDLHVLGTPPAFILSQDQTLRNYSLFLPVLRTTAQTKMPAHLCTNTPALTTMLPHGQLLSPCYGARTSVLPLFSC
jgi:hypothetical protein